MEHIEQFALQACDLKLRLWVRCVEDVFVVAHFSDSEISEFVCHLNGIPPSMRFTVELEKNGQLAFLDVIIWNDYQLGKFAISVY